MGATVSLKKSLNHATCARTRKALARRAWPGMQGAIPVARGARDLGAHLCVSGSPSGCTLTARARA
eukprot:6663541-Alexandrium_andersonii.AAC.1